MAVYTGQIPAAGEAAFMQAAREAANRMIEDYYMSVVKWEGDPDAYIAGVEHRLRDLLRLGRGDAVTLAAMRIFIEEMRGDEVVGDEFEHNETD